MSSSTRRLLSVSFLALALSACGSTNVAPQVTGTIGGQPFAAADAVSAVATFQEGSMAIVAITDRPGICATISDVGKAQGSGPLKLLDVGLGQLDLSTQKIEAPTQGGTFDIFDFKSTSMSPTLPPSLQVAMVEYLAVDATGKDVSDGCQLAKSGTVTITKVDGQAFAGSGDVTMDCGDHITFQFDASPCPGLASLTMMSTSSSGGGPASTAAGAVSLSFSSGPGCPTAGSAIGQISASGASAKVQDGQAGASVTCSVDGTGQFSVDGTISNGATTFNVNIPEISPGATQASPAIGSVSLVSPSEADSFSSCNFYFLPGTAEAVQAGKIQVAFTCPTDGPDSCSVLESYLDLEGCL